MKRNHSAAHVGMPMFLGVIKLYRNQIGFLTKTIFVWHISTKPQERATHTRAVIRKIGEEEWWL